jgi:hypothetical protein
MRAAAHQTDASQHTERTVALKPSEEVIGSFLGLGNLTLLQLVKGNIAGVSQVA